MEQIKKIFKDNNFNDVFYFKTKNPNLPNTLIVVSDILKFWVEVIGETWHVSPELENNIILLRQLGFITGFVQGDKFQMKSGGQVFDFDYVLKGNIAKWLTDDKPVEKNQDIKSVLNEWVL